MLKGFKESRDRKNHRSNVVKEFLHRVENQQMPWQQKLEPNTAFEPPMNPLTNNTYSGVNSLWLEMAGYDDPRWLTEDQARSVGASVLPGEKSRVIEIWQMHERVEKKNELDNTLVDELGEPIFHNVALDSPKLQYAHVYNAAQLDGILEHEPKIAQTNSLERAASLIADSGIEMKHQKSENSIYSLKDDTIHLPEKELFETEHAYYNMAIHALAHATRHPERLDRQAGPFGSQKYATEELRAEMTAFNVSRELGLGNEPGRDAVYIQNWINVIKDDPNLLFQVTTDVERMKEMINDNDLALTNEKTLSAELTAEKAQKQTLAVEPKEKALEPEKEIVQSPIQPAKEVAQDQRPLSSKVKSMQQLIEQNGRVDLTLSFEQKDAVKELGAKYDPENKTWFIDKSNKDLSKFEIWYMTPEEKEKAQTQTKTFELKERIYINVPYAESKDAKALGAKFDRPKKSWYITEEQNRQSFTKWEIKQNHEPTLSPQEEFAIELEKNGLIINGSPIMDGEWHRVQVESDKGKKQSGSYRGFTDGIPTGQIVNYHVADKAVKWVGTGNKEMSPAERAKLQQDMEVRKAERDKTRAEEQVKAAKKSYAIWMNSKELEPNQSHPYLDKKEIDGKGLRIDETGDLVIPLADENGFIKNLQTINTDGTKLYQKNGLKNGLMHVIDPDGLLGKDNKPTFIVEGYATGKSIHEATKMPVVVALDAGNLKPVAEALRKKHPSANLVIAGDDDHKLPLLEKPLPNKGVEKANEAAQAVDGTAIFPKLSLMDKDLGFTDFNDMQIKHGIGGLKEQLRESLLEKRKSKQKVKQKNLAAHNTNKLSMSL